MVLLADLDRSEPISSWATTLAYTCLKICKMPMAAGIRMQLLIGGVDSRGADDPVAGEPGAGAMRRAHLILRKPQDTKPPLYLFQ